MKNAYLENGLQSLAQRRKLALKILIMQVRITGTTGQSIIDGPHKLVCKEALGN